MSDLFDDLQDGSGQDYFFGLDSATGGISPAPATLTISGRAVEIVQQISVFRSPSVATLTLNGRAVSSDIVLSPAPAALSLVGQIAGEYRELIITPAMPTPDYSELQSIPPTILFINTITPTTGLVQLSSPPLNVTEGGNIGFVSPGVGSLSLQTGPLTLIFTEVGIGSLTLSGLAPSLLTELVLSPDVGSLTVNGREVEVERPFGWIDADPPPTTTWTTTTGIAA